MKQCPFTKSECLGEGCAIWIPGHDNAGNECAVVELVNQVHDLREHLAERKQR